MVQKQIDLDGAIKEIGRIGRYQIFVYILIFIPLMIAGIYAVSYVFTAGELHYRCRIDECDDIKNPDSEYLPEWIRNAVPFDEDEDRPETCYRYNLTMANIDQLKCDASDFNRVKIKCNDFIYENDKRTIVNDMDLQCDENKWLLALVGTMHNCGNFINLMICGYFSDKYGRRAVFIFTALASCTMGILRTFAWNYGSFIALEFLQPCLGGGVYTAGFILAMEIVKPEQRAMSSAVMFSVMSFGKVLLGVLAMLFQDWQTILRVGLPLSYVAIAYYWLLPESMRWLLSQGRNAEAASTLLKISKVNKTEISDDLRELLEKRPHDLVLNADNNTNDEVVKDKDETASHADNKFKLVLQYPKLMIRIVLCSLCWLVIVMVFYGLSLIAVSIGGNKYTDFILVQFIEIPAAMSMPFISNRLGRKKIMCGSFLFCGIALILYTFVGDIYGLKLALFLLGKFAIAFAFSNIYIYTSELYPTDLRHTLLGICSAFGRIGSIVAPQAPLLNHYVKNLSMYIFGASALIAAVVSLQFPETLNSKLPDTIEEALNLGRERKVGKEES